MEKVITAPKGFVVQKGNQFSIDGKIFYFAGTNNYYLVNAPQNMVDDVFNNAKAMNLKVMRTWGFIDGDKKGDVVLQPWLGVYNEDGFKRFDYAIKKAGETGIKLVLPFINNWDDYGGINQYVKWTGAANHDDFYKNAACKTAYKNYIAYVLNRVNSYTGVKYKDDPIIMTWELANEPRCKSDPSGETLYSWVKEMSEYIKSIDPSHLVAIGDEGFFKRTSSDWFYNGGEGVDWDRLIAISTIDYGTVHLYPEAWQRTNDWGTQWIKDHVDAGNKVKKPVVLEEYGVKDNKDGVYKTWGDTVVNNNGAGIMFWLLTGVGYDGNLYPDYDGFRVVYPSSTAAILSDIAKQMNAKAASAGSLDYAAALRDAILFYDGNKCGKDAGVNNVFSWRGACHTNDGSDVGLDLTGGYHDAGDHVKFGLPQGYAASVLGWSLYEFRNVFDSTGNTKKMLQQLKHFTDYFLRCHPNANTFYYQVGDGNADHSYWGPPEVQTGSRPTMYFADAAHPASDVLGQTSAALSLMYLNCIASDADYANKCLQAAKELYQMGKANQGCGNGQSFYQSSAYNDDLAWAAVWLYAANHDQQYLSDAKQFIVLNTSSLDDNWTMCWNSIKLPVIVKLADITGEQQYKAALEYNLNYWKNSLKTTTGGLTYLNEWGVLRYAAAESMLALVYYKNNKDESLKTFAQSQIDYILGKNPASMSYMIGFGDTWPKHPHHRAANGYTYANNDNQKEAKNLLLGALVGGPDANDSYKDDVNQYQYTEVAIDYNAGLVGALAGIVEFS